MKIGMTLVCRDEIDIIESQLDYHLPLVDLMVVTDNGSIDGTQDLLNSRQGDNLIVIRDESLNKNQFLQVGRMIRILAEKGIDWVAHTDADEFFSGNLREQIELASSEGHNTFDVPWLTFRPTWRDPLGEACVPKRMLWRECRELQDSKAVHSIAGYRGISQGNHVVHMDEKKSKGRLRELSLYHYPNRGWDRWRGKIIRAGQAYENNNTLDPIFGNHVRSAYQLLKDGGEEALYKKWSTQYAGNDSEIRDMGLIFDATMALEFGSTIPECLLSVDLGNK